MTFVLLFQRQYSSPIDPDHNLAAIQYDDEAVGALMSQHEKAIGSISNLPNRLYHEYLRMILVELKVDLDSSERESKDTGNHIAVDDYNLALDKIDKVIEEVGDYLPIFYVAKFAGAFDAAKPEYCSGFSFTSAEGKGHDLHHRVDYLQGFYPNLSGIKPIGLEDDLRAQDPGTPYEALYKLDFLGFRASGRVNFNPDAKFLENYLKSFTIAEGDYFAGYKELVYELGAKGRGTNGIKDKLLKDPLIRLGHEVFGLTNIGHIPVGNKTGIDLGLLEFIAAGHNPGGHVGCGHQGLGVVEDFKHVALPNTLVVV